MAKIITATALRDIKPICKKGEVVSINVHNKVTEVPHQVSDLSGTKTVMIPTYHVLSITNSNGDTYSYSQLTGIVGYRTPMSELFEKDNEV